MFLLLIIHLTSQSLTWIAAIKHDAFLLLINPIIFEEPLGKNYGSFTITLINEPIAGDQGIKKHNHVFYSPIVARARSKIKILNI